MACARARARSAARPAASASRSARSSACRTNRASEPAPRNSESSWVTCSRTLAQFAVEPARCASSSARRLRRVSASARDWAASFSVSSACCCARRSARSCSRPRSPRSGRRGFAAPRGNRFVRGRTVHGDRAGQQHGLEPGGAQAAHQASGAHRIRRIRISHRRVQGLFDLAGGRRTDRLPQSGGQLGSSPRDSRNQLLPLPAELLEVAPVPAPGRFAQHCAESREPARSPPHFAEPAGSRPRRRPAVWKPRMRAPSCLSPAPVAFAASSLRAAMNRSGVSAYSRAAT